MFISDSGHAVVASMWFYTTGNDWHNRVYPTVIKVRLKKWPKHHRNKLLHHKLHYDWFRVLTFYEKIITKESESIIRSSEQLDYADPRANNQFFTSKKKHELLAELKIQSIKDSMNGSNC